MFFRSTETKTHRSFPGATRRQAAVGNAVQLVSFQFDKGAVVPNHSHPNEQVGMVLTGRVIFHLGGEDLSLGPGDGYSIPPGVEHSAEIVEESTLIDVFSPPREDYKDA